MRGPSRTPSSIFSPQSKSLLTVRLSGDMRSESPLNPSTASKAVDGDTFCREPLTFVAGISLMRTVLVLQLYSVAPWWSLIILSFASASWAVTAKSWFCPSFLLVTDREGLRCALGCLVLETFLCLTFSSSTLGLLCDLLFLCCASDSPLWRSFELLVAHARELAVLLLCVMSLWGVCREALTGVRARVRRLRFSKINTGSDGICSVVGFWGIRWASNGACSSMGWSERVRLLSLSESDRVNSGDFDAENALFSLCALVSSLLESCISVWLEASQHGLTFVSSACSLLPFFRS